MKYYMNKKMVDLIRKTPYKKISLSKELLSILDEGIINKNGCFLFRFFYNANPHLKDNQFEDKTEYEHSVNDFHFNDYCRNCSINHVFLFVNRLKEMAIKMCVSSTMAITISSDNDDFSLSFTTMHGDERPWISPYDLDNFSQPIMIVIIEKITVTGHKGTDM